MNQLSYVTVFALLCMGAGYSEAQDLEFKMASTPLTIQYNIETGQGEGTQIIYMEELPSSPGFVNVVQGFSLSYSLNIPVYMQLAMNYGSSVEFINGGAGPDYWSGELHGNGFTLNTVYAYFTGSSAAVTYEYPKELIKLELVIASGSLIGDSTGFVVLPEFDTHLGMPPVHTLVFVALQAYAPVEYVAGELSFVPFQSSVPELFRRGDSNLDGSVNISDAIWILGSLFGPFAQFPIDCADSADSNDDGAVDIVDAIHLLGYLVSAGQEPPPPFGSCGFDPTLDGLGCYPIQLCN